MTEIDFNRMNCNLEKIEDCLSKMQTANDRFARGMISTLQKIEKQLKVLNENHNVVETA